MGLELILGGIANPQNDRGALTKTQAPGDPRVQINSKVNLPPEYMISLGKASQFWSGGLGCNQWENKQSRDRWPVC